MIPAIDRQYIDNAYAANGGSPLRVRRTPMRDRPGAFLPDQITSFLIPTRA